MGFTRRFGSYPGNEVITQIEGTVIIDQTPPAPNTGPGTGTVCCVGEFADMSLAVVVSTTGEVTRSARALQVFSGNGMVASFGGFDETLGEFGASMGNGFVALANKRFPALVIAPVDLVTRSASATTYACRLVRDLPTNTSATDPTPVVELSPGVVPAGHEFTSSTNRVRTARRIVFTDDAAYASGVTGDVTAAGAATSQSFNLSSGSWPDELVEGDILVVGVIDAAGAQGDNADTYRIKSITDSNTVVVEKLNGASWNWTTGGSLAWRLHVGATADSSGVDGLEHQLSETGGYQVPARPLDATIAAATAVNPTNPADAATASTWDPLSGLQLITHPSGALTYDSAVHAPNVASSAEIDARYASAIDALLSDDDPYNAINIVVAARKSSTIRTKLKTHVGIASERGLTRRAIVAPPVDELVITDIGGDTSPGVGTARSERVDYSWPGCRHSVPEAVGFALATADGKTTTDGILDEPFDTWAAMLEANLPPENNPAQVDHPVPELLAPVLGLQRGVSGLGMPEYVYLRKKGIAALRIDRVTGAQLQSGVTTSLVTGEQNINRRRMADFVQDQLAARTAFFKSVVLTDNNKDAAVGECVAFLDELKSEDNKAAQRIVGYTLSRVDGSADDTSLPTNAFGVQVNCKMLDSNDFFVIFSRIGPTVSIG